THFVVAAFMGWALRWKSPSREDSETTPGEAFRYHGYQTPLRLAWGGAILWLTPAFLPWVLLICGYVAVTIPVSIYSTRVSHDRQFGRAKLFLIPEEAKPPIEMQETVRYVKDAAEEANFVQAVAEPAFNAVVCATGKLHPHRSLLAQEMRANLVQTALLSGPS